MPVFEYCGKVGYTIVGNVFSVLALDLSPEMFLQPKPYKVPANFAAGVSFFGSERGSEICF